MAHSTVPILARPGPRTHSNGNNPNDDNFRLNGMLLPFLAIWFNLISFMFANRQALCSHNY